MSTTPNVGDIATPNIRQSHNPYPVHEVSEDGTQVRLFILGKVTEWMPAANYTYKQAAS